MQSIDPYGKQVSAQRKMIVGASLTALALLVVGIGLGALAAKGGTPTAITPVIAKDSPPVLMTKDEPAPAVLPADNGMPKDVLDWLEHLHQTDDKCIDLAKNQMGSLLGQLTVGAVTMGLDPKKDMFGEDGPNVEKTPAMDLSKSFDDLAGKFDKLETDFNSKPPPAECADIASNYNQALQEKEAMTLEISKTLKDSADDPTAALNKLTGMEDESNKRVDPYRARTDTLVQAICDKYKTRKWFSIPSDVNSNLKQFIGQSNPLNTGGR